MKKILAEHTSPNTSRARIKKILEGVVIALMNSTGIKAIKAEAAKESTVGEPGALALHLVAKAKAKM